MSYSIWAAGGGYGNVWTRYQAETWAEAVRIYLEQVGYSGGMDVVLTEDVPLDILDGRRPPPAAEETTDD